jgi:hypothetical protein
MPNKTRKAKRANKTKAKSKPQKQKQKPQKSKPSKPKSIGAQIGALVGDGLQNFGTSVFNRIMGKGDYTMPDTTSQLRKNCLFQNGNNQPPTFGGGKSGFVFEHSEYVGDIITSSTAGAFNSQTYAINPSNSVLFPWLSNLSTNFEMFQIDGMIFRYESTSGNAISGTNAALGTVMGYVAYDTLDNVLTSKSALLQYEGAVDARMDQNFLVGVECDPKDLPMPRLYVGYPPAGSDAKTYNWGNFTIATQGSQGTSANVGELWVHYRIKFLITKQQSAAASTHLYMNAIGSTSSVGTMVSSTGTIQLVANPANTVNSLIGTNFNVGSKYQLIWNAFSANLNGAASFFSFTGATLTKSYIALADSGEIALSGGHGLIVECFTATSSTVVMTTAAGWSTSSGSYVADIIITQEDNITQ